MKIGRTGVYYRVSVLNWKRKIERRLWLKDSSPVVMRANRICYLALKTSCNCRVVYLTQNELSVIGAALEDKSV